MKVGLIASAIIWSLIIAACSGCGGSAGWRFEIGVSPVTALDNRASLEQVKDEAK